MANGLFESQVEEVVKGGLYRIIEGSRLEWIKQTKKNWDFYGGNQLCYARQYPGESDDEFKSKQKAVFNYTGAVIDEYMSGVYQMPVTRVFKTKINREIYDKISSSFDLHGFFKKVQKIAELSALCGVVIRTNATKTKLFLDAIPGEYIKIATSRDQPDGVEHVIIAYNFDADDQRGLGLRVEGWSRNRVVIYEVFGKHVDKVYDESNAFVDDVGEPFIPIVFFRPDEDANSPYGISKIDSIVSINEAYNSMWMDVMRTVRMQQFSLLFVKRPASETQEAPAPLNIAPTRMIEDSSPDADAKYITPDPKIEACLKTLRALREDLMDLSRVPIEVLAGSSKQGVESASTLRVKMIPVEKVWSQRKASYGSSEMQLWKKIILASKGIWGIGDISDLKPQIDYGEVPLPLDVEEDLKRTAQDLQLGLTNPYELYLKRDPDIGTLEDAAKKVHFNVEATKKVLDQTLSYGITSPEESVEDFIKRLQEFRQAANRVQDDLNAAK